MTDETDSPRYLYRYCKAERAFQTLRDGELFLGSLGSQNDGFEGCAASLLYYSAAIAHELEVRRFIGLGGLDRAKPERLAASIDEKEKHDNFNYVIEHLKPLLKTLRQHCGVICFSESGFNQRMWDGYADHRRGACIQFRGDRDPRSLRRLAKPISYSNELQQGLLLEVMNSDGSLEIDKMADAMFFSKTKDWEDEKEWRILMKANSPQTDESRKLKFQICDIRRVFLGARMPSEDKQRFHRLSSDQGNKWSVVETSEDPDLGAITFSGIEIGRYPEDFDWHSGHGMKDSK
ncbi:MAG: hypothetical protein JWO19_5870 [Bryobacterales bacterium]|nr:hypothetical protein [Bryobacterales bacterium]